MATSSQAQRSRRQQLEAQRLAEAQKERRNRIIFAGVGVLVLAVVIVVAVIGIAGSSTKLDPNAPPNVNADQNGIYLGPVTEGAPLLEIFVDYNCPLCAKASIAFNDTLHDAMDQGKANVLIHPLSFEGDTSVAAAVAASCSDFEGKFADFHFQLFLNQDTAFDTLTLRDQIPDNVKMFDDDLKNYQDCFNNQDTRKFVNRVAAYGTKMKVNSTPTILLDGENITTAVYNYTTLSYDPDLLRAKLGLS